MPFGIKTPSRGLGKGQRPTIRSNGHQSDPDKGAVAPTVTAVKTSGNLPFSAIMLPKKLCKTVTQFATRPVLPEGQRFDMPREGEAANNIYVSHDWLRANGVTDPATCRVKITVEVVK